MKPRCASMRTRQKRPLNEEHEMNTDTAALVEKLRSPWHHADCRQAAAKIEQQDHEIARLRALLADADILAQHSGAGDSREWHTAQCWLRPGEVLAHMDAPPEVHRCK